MIKRGGNNPALQARIADAHNRGLAAGEIAAEVGLSRRCVEAYRAVLDGAGVIQRVGRGEDRREAKWAAARPFVIRWHGRRTRDAIAAMAGCTPQTIESVRCALYAEGVLRPLATQVPRLTEDQRRAARAGIAAGQSLAVIGRALGISPKVVGKIRDATPAAPMAAAVGSPPGGAAMVRRPAARLQLSDYQARMVDSLMSLGHPHQQAVEAMRAKISADARRQHAKSCAA